MTSKNEWAQVPNIYDRAPHFTFRSIKRTGERFLAGLRKLLHEKKFPVAHEKDREKCSDVDHLDWVQAMSITLPRKNHYGSWCGVQNYDPGNFQHRVYVFDADYGNISKKKKKIHPAPTTEYLMRRKIAWCGHFFDPGKTPQMRKKNEASPHEWGRT